MVPPAVNPRSEAEKLERELTRFEETHRVLAARLELTMAALALTLDAQASTRQRLDALGHGSRRRIAGASRDLEREAERYRLLAALMALDNQAVPVLRLIDLPAVSVDPPA